MGNASIGITPRRVGTRLPPRNGCASTELLGQRWNHPRSNLAGDLGRPCHSPLPPGTAAPQSLCVRRAPLTSKPPNLQRLCGGFEGEQVLPFSPACPPLLPRLGTGCRHLPGCSLARHRGTCAGTAGGSRARGTGAGSRGGERGQPCPEPGSRSIPSLLIL